MGREHQTLSVLISDKNEVLKQLEENIKVSVRSILGKALLFIVQRGMLFPLIFRIN